LIGLPAKGRDHRFHTAPALSSVAGRNKAVIGQQESPFFCAVRVAAQLKAASRETRESAIGGILKVARYHTLLGAFAQTSEALAEALRE
jgi:hypothetical protein